ncbi:MAG: NTP transferase domain-containing protein [Clostridia bacterium]|nr:NTP transferase domain-containing protein [Clostridia bacterium]
MEKDFSGIHIKYVIIQAGGKGTRLGHNTWNKPKCLVSLNGKPMLYSLFEAFPGAEFIVIGDYHYEILEKYIKSFPPEGKVTLIKASGTGTCSGIQEAVGLLPDRDTPFALVWSDLQFTGCVRLREYHANTVGVSYNLKCRWSMVNNELKEIAADMNGVLGFFYFGNPSEIGTIPESGEFVRFLSQSSAKLEAVCIENCFEVGTETALEEHRGKCVTRFFNNVTVTGNKVIKKAKVDSFEHLIQKEVQWYRELEKHKCNYIPQVYSTDPLTMEYIDGVHPFELDVQDSGKEEILADIIGKIKHLHSLALTPNNIDDIKGEYIEKTISRFNRIKTMFDNFFYDEYIVNGKPVQNILHPLHMAELHQIVEFLPRADFTLIHGDPTFSNIIVDRDLKAWFIDPRGYFGNQLLYGDPNYDFYKLFYSIEGNYDMFNRKRFSLRIFNKQIELNIPESPWSRFKGLFYTETGLEKRAVDLAHGLIWISLSGYAVDDVDSIFGAFFKGLELIADAYRA